MSVIMAMQIISPLAASGIALAVITILVNRFGVTRSDRWRALFVTTFVVVVGCVTFFATQAVATKISENEEAYEKTWMELLEEGDGVRAERKLQQRIRQLRESYGKEHPDHSPILFNLAYVYKEQGKNAKAEKLYLDTLELLRTDLDGHYYRYCYGLAQTAAFYRGIGDFERAESRYLEAVDVTAAAVGVENKSYAMCLWDLGRFYHLCRDLERAEIRYKQAIAVLEVISPPDSRLLDSFVTSYTRMLRERGRDSAADAVLERFNPIASEEEF